MKQDMSPADTKELLRNAELSLVNGNFLRANTIAKKAGGLLDSTRQLHRKFMDNMKSLVSRMEDMEELGYDISEASDILDRARNNAMKSEYKRALNIIKRASPALDRATYLPFPLLNKNVDIISTILFDQGKLSYNVRIENPTAKPLGEIIIRPFLPEGEFQEVQERYYGIIGPREFKESTFILVPKVSDWNVGVGREVLMGEGVVLKTKLSSREGSAKYTVTIENNSDQIIRDISLSPMAPGGLEADPSRGVIEFVEPFAQRSFEFDLYPTSMADRSKERGKEKVVVLEEEPDEDYEAVEDEGSWVVEEDSDEEWEEGPEDGEMDVVVKTDEGPRDFTPVKEEYNLISMSPYKYSDRVDKSMKKARKRRRKA